MKIFIQSVGYALAGIRSALAGRNFRIQAFVAVVVIVAGLTLGVSAGEWLVIFLFIALVLALEMVNSAIENMVNLVSPEYHPVAGRVKDLCAGAVLVVCVLATVAGLIIFLPYFWRLI
jgi:diacylglycerol kinase